MKNILLYMWAVGIIQLNTSSSFDFEHKILWDSLKNLVILCMAIKKSQIINILNSLTNKVHIRVESVYF